MSKAVLSSQVTKYDVDLFTSGKRIPKCEMVLVWENKSLPPKRVQHKIGLRGARGHTFFLLVVDPGTYIDMIEKAFVITIHISWLFSDEDSNDAITVHSKAGLSKCCTIIESVDSICRDTTDTQLKLIQKNLSSDGLVQIWRTPSRRCLHKTAAFYTEQCTTPSLFGSFEVSRGA